MVPTPNSASQPYCFLSFVSVNRRLVCILHFFNSGVGGAMCIPVVLPSEYPKGYGPIQPFPGLHQYVA